MKNKQISLILFLILQLYIYVMSISFTNLINTNILSLMSIILCFIIAIFMRCKTRDYIIMVTAISFTLIYDLLSIVLPNNIISLFLLNVIQIIYFFRTYIDSESKKENILCRIMAIPICLFIGYIFLKNKITLDCILWIIYIINLFINLLFTIKEIGLNNLFPIGLIFLLIHGFILMFLSLENYISVNVYFINILTTLPFDIKTMFYIPAQTILTCSIFTVNRRCFSKVEKEDN